MVEWYTGDAKTMKLKHYLQQPFIKDYIVRDKYLEICDSVFAIDSNPYSTYLSQVADINYTDKPNGLVACSNSLVSNLPKCKKVVSVWEDDSISKCIGVKMFATNVTTTSSFITSVPIGRDWRGIEVIENFKPKRLINSKLIYFNFAQSTNPKRSEIFNRYEQVDWATMIEVKEWMNYPIDRESFYQDLYQHKFVVCPEGNGIDTFRCWDALYMKSIPIVQTSIHMKAFEDLPILYVDDYTNLNADELSDTYHTMLETKYNFELLEFEYWKKQILESYMDC